MQSPQPFHTQGPVDGPFSSQHRNNPAHQPSNSHRQPSREGTPASPRGNQHAPSDQSERLFKYIEVYGSKFALQIKESSTQQKGQKKPWSTLMFESAKRNNPNSSDRTYNWQKGAKISFQLTLNDPPFLLLFYSEWWVM